MKALEKLELVQRVIARLSDLDNWIDGSLYTIAKDDHLRVCAVGAFMVERLGESVFADREVVITTQEDDGSYKVEISHAEAIDDALAYLWEDIRRTARSLDMNVEQDHPKYILFFVNDELKHARTLKFLKVLERKLQTSVARSAAKAAKDAQERLAMHAEIRDMPSIATDPYAPLTIALAPVSSVMVPA